MQRFMWKITQEGFDGKPHDGLAIVLTCFSEGATQELMAYNLATSWQRSSVEHS
jgi:hypothetical protein